MISKGHFTFPKQYVWEFSARKIPKKFLYTKTSSREYFCPVSATFINLRLWDLYSSLTGKSTPVLDSRSMHLAIVTACQKLFMGVSNMHGQIAPDSRIMSCAGAPYTLRESQPRGLVESVVCGAVHTLAVTVAGLVASVWGCVSNLELQLRNNRNDDRCYNFWTELDISKLRAAQTTPGAVRVAAGRDFSVVAVAPSPSPSPAHAPTSSLPRSFCLLFYPTLPVTV
jgi:hypothetical protein